MHDGNLKFAIYSVKMISCNLVSDIFPIFTTFFENYHLEQEKKLDYQCVALCLKEEFLTLNLCQMMTSVARKSRDLPLGSTPHKKHYGVL